MLLNGPGRQLYVSRAFPFLLLVNSQRASRTLPVRLARGCPPPLFRYTPPPACQLLLLRFSRLFPPFRHVTAMLGVLSVFFPPVLAGRRRDVSTFSACGSTLLRPLWASQRSVPLCARFFDDCLRFRQQGSLPLSAIPEPDPSTLPGQAPLRRHSFSFPGPDILLESVRSFSARGRPTH